MGKVVAFKTQPAGCRQQSSGRSSNGHDNFVIRSRPNHYTVMSLQQLRVLGVTRRERAVSYTHLTLPTNREV
eukprot:9241043-Heterocapsa_arctica.AAC.1